MKTSIYTVLHIICVCLGACAETDDPDIQKFYSSESDHGDSTRGIIIYGAEPPEGSVMENWIMHYDDILAIGYTSEKHKPDSLYSNWTRDVKVVKTKSEFYIRGISVSYPDAWIKGEYVNDKPFGSRIKFADAQLTARHIYRNDTVSRYFTPSRFYDNQWDFHDTIKHIGSKPTKNFIYYNYDKDEGFLTLYVPDRVYDEDLGTHFVTEFDYGFVLTKGIDKTSYVYKHELHSDKKPPYLEADSIRKDAEMYPHVWFEKKRP